MVAAGRGTRMGGELPKPFLLIDGIPVLLRAVEPFAGHPDVAQVVVVLPAAEAESPPAFLTKLMAKGLAITVGGSERSD